MLHMETLSVLLVALAAVVASRGVRYSVFQFYLKLPLPASISACGWPSHTSQFSKDLTGKPCEFKFS